MGKVPLPVFQQEGDEQSECPFLDSIRLLDVNAVQAARISAQSKTCALDPLPTVMIKKVGSILSLSITSLVNMSLGEGTFPHQIKTALATPVLKKPSLDPELLSNYRPIFHFLSKLIERVAASQLYEHLEANRLHIPVQSAYRQKHSTESALVRLFNDLLICVDKEMAAIVVYLEISAAFGTVDHFLLNNN